MSQAQLLAACVLITVLIGTGVAVLKAAAYLWRALRKIVRLADDLTGEPATGMMPARPGVLDRLAAIEDRLRILDGIDARMALVESRFHATPEVED